MPQYTVQTNYGNKTVNADSPQQAQQLIQQGGQTVGAVYASTPTPEAGGSGTAAPAIDLLTATPEQTQQITQATMSPVASSTPGVVQPTTATPVQQPLQTPQTAPAPVPQPTQPAQQTQAVIQPSQTSLVDIYNSRLDLQQAFPNALVPGATNQALNDWWNTYGMKEYPNTQLVAPGTQGIQDPKTLAAPGPQPIQATPTVQPTAPPTAPTTPTTPTTPTAPTTPTPAAPATPQNATSLVDIWSSRPDLQEAFPNGLQAGSNDNRLLNDWWVNHGTKEYPNTQLVAPGSANVQDPTTLESGKSEFNQPTNPEISDVKAYDFAKDPIKAYTQLYTDALKAAGVSTFKSEYEKLATSQAEEISEEMNNPWLTESIKNARIKKINDKYEVKLGLYKTLYDQGIQEAKFITDGAYGAYADKTKADATALQNAASNALDLAKLQGGSEMTPDIKEYVFSVGQGYNGLLTDWQKEKYQATHAGSGGGDFDKLLSPSEAQALGVPYGTTRAGAFGVTPERPATSAQETVAGYASRIEQSLPTIERLTNDISKMGALNFERMRISPSYLQSSSFRQFDQAARNFINANLRRESGAVIADTEFDNAYKQYLPRAGDDAETLKQKKLNRDIVFASFKRASGPAYQSIEDLFGGRPTVNTNNLIQQVDEDINDYASEYNYGGGREDLLKVLQESYPELSEEELGNRVYTLIPSK